MTTNVIDLNAFRTAKAVVEVPTPTNVTPLQVQRPPSVGEYNLGYPLKVARAAAQKRIDAAQKDAALKGAVAVAMVLVYPSPDGKQHPAFEWSYTLTGSAGYDNATVEALRTTADQIVSDLTPSGGDYA